MGILVALKLECRWVICECRMLETGREWDRSYGRSLAPIVQGEVSSVPDRSGLGVHHPQLVPGKGIGGTY
ncbi:MAG: hypothetical protein OXQ29_09080 [Rhodospirillaceae bacterium]|nr:hypothetical protein [Rhodospirillaceae bacterium]